MNAWTTDSQGIPAIARAGNRFVVVWQSRGQDGSDEGILRPDARLRRIRGQALHFRSIHTRPSTRFTRTSPRRRTVALSWPGWTSRRMRSASRSRVDDSLPTVPRSARNSKWMRAVSRSPLRSRSGATDDSSVAYPMDPPAESSLNASEKVLPPDAGIYARRYQSDGAANGGSFLVQTTNVAPLRRRPSLDGSVEPLPYHLGRRRGGARTTLFLHRGVRSKANSR